MSEWFADNWQFLLLAGMCAGAVLWMEHAYNQLKDLGK